MDTNNAVGTAYFPQQRNAFAKVSIAINNFNSSSSQQETDDEIKPKQRNQLIFVRNI